MASRSTPVITAGFQPPFLGGGTDRSVVDDLSWTQSLKQATFRQRNGANANGQLPDPTESPQPAIESILPVMISQGSPTTNLTLKGFNFIRKSRVLVDGESVPYRVISPTELQLTLDENLLKKAGRFDVQVVSPEPLQNPQWGNGASNKAHLLVTFGFTRIRTADAK